MPWQTVIGCVEGGFEAVAVESFNITKVMFQQGRGGAVIGGNGAKYLK